MRGIFLRWACVCAALLLFVGPATGAALAAGKPFVAPVAAEVSRKFEAPSHKFGRGHRGIDYGVPSGTTVRASGEGTVTFAGRVADDGLFVTIEHVGDIETTYSYLSRIDVSKGDRVSQGQTIALSGDGHPGGEPALHFGAKRNGLYLDPESLLKEFDDIRDLISLVPVQSRVAGDSPAIQSNSLFVDSSDKPQIHFPGKGEANVPEQSAPVATEGGQSVQGRPTGEMVAPGAATASSVGSGLEDALPPRKRGQTDAEWWQSLPDDLKQQIVDSDPQHWARQFGVSSRDRDTINRMLLDQKIEELERYRKSWPGRLELARQTGWNGARAALSPWLIRSKFDREAAIDRKLRSARELKRQLSAVTRNADNRLSRTDVYLLDFDIDFADGDGKAVVALGDPVTADHIGVVVPGINNAVGSISGTLDDAATLRSQVHRSIDSNLTQRTSTIAWLGYDNPNGLHDAANRSEANEGAPWLEGFVNELRAGHEKGPEAPHISVFGHSYGSTVTGLAAIGGMKADDVVFFGSPGMGKFFSKAEDLPQKRVWAAQSLTDPINWINGALGTNPAAPWFGARKISLGPENRGHSDYILQDSAATIDFAKILTGRIRDLE